MQILEVSLSIIASLLGIVSFVIGLSNKKEIGKLKSKNSNNRLNSKGNNNVNFQNNGDANKGKVNMHGK